jgi:hypothetical protein
MYRVVAVNTILDKSTPDTDRAPPAPFSYDIFSTRPVACGIRINLARRLLTSIHYFPNGGRVDGYVTHNLPAVKYVLLLQLFVFMCYM